MRDGGRISAAIEILTMVIESRRTVKFAVRQWSLTARYAGSNDRAWIAGLVYEALRYKNSASWIMDSDNPRAIVLGTLRLAWEWGLEDIQKVFSDTYAPKTPLTDFEQQCLKEKSLELAPEYIRGDYPKWLHENVSRVFQSETIEECRAFTKRADTGLRINTLKASPEEIDRILRKSKGEHSKFLKNAIRIPASDPTLKDTSLERIPAYSKGIVEVQDEGSQIAVLASNVKPNEKVLDFCAGAGGKTLALASLMSDKGEIFAYDRDARRLAMMTSRLKKSSATIIKLIDTKNQSELKSLLGQFDCVLLDVPCTGTGTWRRRPETKWLLTESALKRRILEQRQILRESMKYLKPTGRLVYITCSFLKEEAEDQIENFLAENTDFKFLDSAKEAISSGQLTEYGEKLVQSSKTEYGGVRLTPIRTKTDGFFFAVLKRIHNKEV